MFKLYKAFYLTLIFVLLFVSAHAQTLVKGKIRDKRSIPVPGAHIFLHKDSVLSTTDSLGNFSFSSVLCSGDMLRISAFGFREDSLRIDSVRNFLYVSRFLKDAQEQLNTVDISSRLRFNNVNPEISQNPITAATAAGAAADVTLALQVFPGAAPQGNETGFFVRGGSAAETAVVFDGLLVKNAFGSKLPDLANRSRFSIFLFDNTAFTTDGFSVAYGQALSSVLTMDTKGIAPKSSTEFALINLGLGVARTERFKNSSITIGANYYNFKPYHQLVRQNTSWQKDPLQYQGNLSYKLKVAKHGMLKVFVDYSNTDLSFQLINPNNRGLDLLENNNKNLYLNTNYQGMINDQWKIYAGVGYNSTKENGSIAGNTYFQLDQISQQRLMFTKLFGPDFSLRFGGEYFQSERKEGFAQMARAYQDQLAAAFAEADVSVFSWMDLNAGMRTEHSRYLGKSNVSPRINAKYFPWRDHQVKLSYGVYYQKPDDSFLAETADLDFEKNRQLALDYDIKMGYRLLKLSAYHKKYLALTEINTAVFSGFQAYGPPLQINGFRQNGGGKAQGLELFYKDKNSIKLVEFSLSYGYVDTKRKYLDYPDFGRPAFAPAHTVNLVVQKVNQKANWFVSGLYTYSSGRTYFNPLNPVFMGDRTKKIHNLSLSLTHLPQLGKTLSTFNLNVNNVLGIKNVYGYRYAFDGGYRRAVLPPANRSILLSFLMNIDGDNFNR